MDGHHVVQRAVIEKLAQWPARTNLRERWQIESHVNAKYWG